MITFLTLNTNAFSYDSAQVANDITVGWATIVRRTNNTKEFEQSIYANDKFYWKIYIRAIYELWNNQEDLNDDLDVLYSFFRIKLYLGIGYKPSKNTRINFEWYF